MFETPYTIRCTVSEKRAAEIDQFLRKRPHTNVIDFVCADSHNIHYSNMFLFGFDRLSNYISDGRCLHESTCMEIIVQILRGLRDVESISHGNVGIGNILVRSDDTGGKLDVRLGVFGEACDRTEDILSFSIILLQLWQQSHLKFIEPLLHCIYSSSVTADHLLGLMPIEKLQEFPIYGQIEISKETLMLALTKFLEDSSKRMAYNDRRESAPLKRRNVPELIKSAINFLFTK